MGGEVEQGYLAQRGIGREKIAREMLRDRVLQGGVAPKHGVREEDAGEDLGDGAFLKEGVLPNGRSVLAEASRRAKGRGVAFDHRDGDPLPFALKIPMMVRCLSGGIGSGGGENAQAEQQQKDPFHRWEKVWRARIPV